MFQLLHMQQKLYLLRSVGYIETKYLITSALYHLCHEYAFRHGGRHCDTIALKIKWMHIICFFIVPQHSPDTAVATSHNKGRQRVKM